MVKIKASLCIVSLSSQMAAALSGISLVLVPVAGSGAVPGRALPGSREARGNAGSVSEL